ncbi:MAG: hypothetical protein WAL02_11550, partial [Rhodoplanes sp.]
DDDGKYLVRFHIDSLYIRLEGGDDMRALILYTVLVIVGTVIAIFIGLFVEREITDAGSVVVFLALFFANFYVSWVITKAVVERTLKTSAPDDAAPSA